MQEQTTRDLDYLNALKALIDIPFPVGKKLLVDFLRGEKTDQISRNSLNRLPHFGSLGYSESEIFDMVTRLLSNGMIEMTYVKKNSFIKGLFLTPKGRDEISNPTLQQKKLAYNFKEFETIITDQEKQLFLAFGPFLEKYNNEQKKAIISNFKHILCLAGAGSGKTTVLTKRIEFLSKYKSVDPSKILAITFTRKARQQMREKLDEVPGLDYVHVETFNSFCEKILRKHNDLLYDRQIKVITYGDKIKILKKALMSLNLNIDTAIDRYFTPAQIRGKTRDQLSNILLNDSFFVRDYFKFKNKIINEEELDIGNSKHEKAAKLFFGICNYIESYMKKHGMRDFADQLVDAIQLFKSNPETIPQFEHILVDEYQDVNKTQIELLSILNPNGLFVVGDPRQSIYGWRGSDINYILNFEKEYDKPELISLKKNYRSDKRIVNLFNEGIKDMNLPDLVSHSEELGKVKIVNLGNESDEDDFIIQAVKNGTTRLSEVFVISRINKRLNELSDKFKQHDIPHVVRSNENKKVADITGDAVTLATIHAIKGLEAETVFVIGCSPNNFPCIGTEHPVIEMVKIDEYDKEEEEKRVFYVALSRAKNNLILTYSTKNHTSYISSKMKGMIDGIALNKKDNKNDYKTINTKSNTTQSSGLMERLKSWRKEMSQQLSVPAYIVFNDSTLIDLCNKKPMNEADLEDVNGFGPTKIGRYGEEILNIINGM